jgi:integrase
LAYQEAREKHMPTIHERLKNIRAFFGDDTPLVEIEGRTDAYILARRKAGAKNGTINREIAFLNHSLGVAWRTFKMIRHRPFIEKLPEAPPRDRELSEAEEAVLRPQCSQDFRDLIDSALLTGMRQGELIRLPKSRVDLEQRLIDFLPTKKGVKRLIPINERLYYLLCRRCAGLSPDDLVFSLGSHPWQRWQIRNRLRAAITAAKIEPITFHDLRHTAASRLRRAGADMEYIRKVLGHRGMQTTRGYVHYEAEQLRPIMALLDSLTASTKRAQEPVPEVTLAGNLSL